MHASYPERARFNELILMDENNMVIYLEAGENIIRPSKKYESSKGVGLIPIGNKVEKIKTQGLKYNMGNKGDPESSLDFSRTISVANEIVGDEVRVNNSHPVLFCTTLKSANV